MSFKVLSLFSGIGAFEKALKNIGVDYDLVGYSEIDKYASKSYAAVHNVDESMNLGDITKINEKELPKDIDLITYGYPCFTGDSLITTSKGLKEIKDISVGDYVLSHDKKYHKVTKWINQGEKQIWKINAMAFDEIRTTENHKFYARKKCGNKFQEPMWIECKDLTSDYYLGVPVNDKEIIPIWEGVEYTRGHNTYLHSSLSKEMSNPNFWYIVGRWLGDGWTVRRKNRNNNFSKVVISCPHEQVEELKERIERCFNCTISKERTATKIYISNKEFAMFLEQFGHGAEKKYVPDFVINLPIKLLEAFIYGYYKSDGCTIKNSLKFSTVSRKLAYTIAQCIMKVYKKPVSIYKIKTTDNNIIEGRVVNQRDWYQIAFRKDTQTRGFYEDGYIWYPIKGVEKIDKIENVYDITVEDSHSFVVNNCIAHNCQDISLAGKQKGLFNEDGSKTRSGLFFDALRIIEEIQPRVAIAENVKNLVGKKFKPQFDIILDSLDKAGYNNYWQVLNAKDYGIPQNRERVFIVSIRKDIDNGNFKFPELFELKLRLKDMLDDEVDEKYYLSKEQIDRINNSNFMQEKKRLQEKDYVDTLLARDYKDPKCVAVEPKRIGVLFDTETSKHQAGSIWDKERISPTIDTMQGGYRQPLVTIDDNVSNDEIKINVIGSYSPSGHDTSRIVDENGLAPTAKENHGTVTATIQNYRIRKLTPKECWKLMGFDDEDFEKAEKVNSNTQLYKQAGNSIVVDVLENIFIELFKQNIVSI